MKETQAKKILIGVPPKAHVSLAQDELRALQALGWECFSVPYGRNNQSVGVLNKFFSTLVKAFVLVGRLYRIRPQYLYLNSRFERAGSTRDFISLLTVKLLYFGKIKIFIKSHGSEAHRMQHEPFFIRSLVMPFLTRVVDGWFFLSSDEKQLLSGYNAALASKIHIVPNIIDPNRCVASAGFNREYGLPEEKFKILFVGRMVREKGIFDLLNAIPAIEDRENCIFIFVGSGNDEEKLRQEASLKGLQPYCRFMGYLPDAECDHFYANTDLLIFPTYDTEGFAMALFKSVSAGLPVLTTKIRAAKDYLQEPENLLWINEKDPSSIAGAVNRMIAEKELLQNMRANNRRLGEKFSAENVANLMTGIFGSV